MFGNCRTSPFAYTVPEIGARLRNSFRSLTHSLSKCQNKEIIQIPTEHLVICMLRTEISVECFFFKKLLSQYAELSIMQGRRLIPDLEETTCARKLLCFIDERGSFHFM